MEATPEGLEISYYKSHPRHKSQEHTKSLRFKHIPFCTEKNQQKEVLKGTIQTRKTLTSSRTQVACEK